MGTEQKIYNVGIDIGSTTVKVVFIDAVGKIVHSDYRRHNADIMNSLKNVFKEAYKHIGEAPISIAITGSAGLGISEKFDVPFIQEVVAAAETVKRKYSDVRILMDIGGEDAKMIFFEKGKIPDIRMNGSCAGGTGSFIDQMSSLLNITPSELNTLVAEHKNIYPIASRCGVFSKTDVQNLIAKNIPLPDIAASVFNAISIQTLTSLARGSDILPKILFCGGPFSFLSHLKDFFVKRLNLQEDDYIIPEHAEIISALGCAIYEQNNESKVLKTNVTDFITTLANYSQKGNIDVTQRLPALFKDADELEKWKEENEKYFIETLEVKDLNDDSPLYLGIDSGSTTTKIVVTNEDEKIVYSFYERNNGKPLEVVKEGLELFKKKVIEAGKQLKIVRSAVTGYGEDLIKNAFSLNYGIVETIAHYTAARKFNENVSFILDIGGQDMKAIFVENGAINRLEINEACSSGCGSFIEGFANTLNYSVADFAKISLLAKNPCDLGTRCTVFMNSKVKQFLREGVEVADIAAGLAYSVVKNCLYKVLKIKDITELGGTIVVQGGTFRNKSVQRTLEILTKQNIICSSIPELMGAYGCALYASRK